MQKQHENSPLLKKKHFVKQEQNKTVKIIFSVWGKQSVNWLINW